MFLSAQSLASGTWQALERAVCRLLTYEGYEGIRLVGGVGDRGADILGHKNGRRFLYQVKHWKTKVGPSVVDETLKARIFYRAHVPVVVSLSGFDESVRQHQHTLLSMGIPLQLLDRADLEARGKRLNGYPPHRASAKPYQEPIIQAIVKAWEEDRCRALIVMATGVGKTIAAAESIRRITTLRPTRTLILAHTNELVYQLERAFWPFLTADQRTVVWNGYESPGENAVKMRLLFLPVIGLSPIT